MFVGVKKKCFFFYIIEVTRLDMSKLYFLCENDLDHHKIQKYGYGASEFQFYMLAKKLADKNINITIFNQSSINSKLDNIEYRLYDDLLNNINIDTNAIVIVSRNFKILKLLLKIFKENKIILWSQDYIEKYNTYFANIDDFLIVNEKSIKIIAVSNFHKENLSKYINPQNIIVMYNILYPEIYKKCCNISINKYNIVFASAWSKGLDIIIALFDRLNVNYPQFKLVVLRPNYNKCECPYRPYIQLLDTIDNKIEYCKILQSSLCTITSKFPETFGCVFAESYFLNTPVIATNKINGLHEFIDNQHVCDLDNYQEFENILLNFF
jgi:hypothetical protein